jgi:topoisomerase-4 subunit B
VPTVEIVFTRLHAGGKFDKGKGGAYAFSAACTAAACRSRVRWPRAWKSRSGAAAAAHASASGGDVVEPLKSPPRETRNPAPASRSGRMPILIPHPSRWASCNACCAQGRAAAGREGHAGNARTATARPGSTTRPARLPDRTLAQSGMANPDPAVRGRAVRRPEGFAEGEGAAWVVAWTEGAMARILRQPDPPPAARTNRACATACSGREELRRDALAAAQGVKLLPKTCLRASPSCCRPRCWTRSSRARSRSA